MFFVLAFCAAPVSAAVHPVAQAVLADKIKVARFKNSLPPVARMILFDKPKTDMEMLVSERGEAPVLKESNWDDLPVRDAPTGDITDFFRQFIVTENVPEIITPRDGDMLPDNYNIHIRVNYEGDEPCFAEINSTSSSSMLEIKDKELIILSSKLVRGREYHLRVKVGRAYSDTVSFRVGNRYADDIEKIIANSDVVAIGPRIDMSEIFPNGIFHSEEEADAGMTTITVKVWRANATEVEVDEEQIVDEVVKTVRVPVTRFISEDAEEADEDGLMTHSVGGYTDDYEPETEEVPEGSVTETENGPEEEAEEADVSETDEASLPEENDEGDDTEAEETDAAETDEDIAEPDSENDADIITPEKPEYVTVEEYTEITTVEYVTKTVKRTVKQGELYSDTMSITVNRALADSYVSIFDELYAIKFPIESAGCYNWRNTVSGRISEHALGTAIDINPDQNYCIYGDGSTVGEYWRPYEDIYSVTPEVVNIFRKYNFSWGGSWITPKDYMHFSYFGT